MSKSEAEAPTTSNYELIRRRVYALKQLTPQKNISPFEDDDRLFYWGDELLLTLTVEEATIEEEWKRNLFSKIWKYVSCNCGGTGLAANIIYVYKLKAGL